MHIETEQPSSTPRVIKVGLVPGPLKGLNFSALRYLILNLNTLQHSMEYEFLPGAPDDPLMQRLASRAPGSSHEISSLLPAFERRYRLLLADQADGYGLSPQLPDYLIILSLSTLSDGYYIVGNGSNGFIALGNWRRLMAPPSVIEFILFMVLRVSLALAYPRLAHSAHLGTKGCIGDFTPFVSDSRYLVLNGLICSQCRIALQSQLSPEGLADLERILSRTWLGGIGDPLSPASICTKLGHDLFMTRGVKPTGFEILLETCQKEGVKQIITLLGGILLAAVIVWLGLKK